MRVGFVKEVGFKPGVKERWSYRCTKWWMVLRQSRTLHRHCWRLWEHWQSKFRPFEKVEEIWTCSICFERTKFYYKLVRHCWPTLLRHCCWCWRTLVVGVAKLRLRPSSPKKEVADPLLQLMKSVRLRAEMSDIQNTQFEIYLILLYICWNTHPKSNTW